MLNVNKKANMVVHSNDLIEAFYDSDLTATEHKVIRYASSRLKDNPEMFPYVEFSVKEFMEAGGMTGRNYHKTIKNIGDGLSRKRISLQDDKRLGWIPWLSTMYYEDGLVKINFNSALKNLLLGLDSRFTKYNYRFIGSMQSSYSIRVYELLKQYAPIKKRKVYLDDLRKLLGVEDKYKSYGNFKQRVLNQAKKEMDERGVLTFTFDEIKEGRKVVGVVFHIELREKELNPEDVLASSKIEDFTRLTKELLDRYNLKVRGQTILGWDGEYSLLIIEEVLEHTKKSKSKQPDAFPNKVVEVKKSEYISRVDNVKASGKEEKIKILQFVEEYKTGGGLTEWFLE